MMINKYNQNILEILPTQGEYSVDETNVFHFPSHVNNETYEIIISKPTNCPDVGDDGKYPTVYVLDGHWHTYLIHTLAGAIRHDGDIPPVNVVGITWLNKDNLMEQRRRDFAIKTKAYQTNKVPPLREFMEKELIPYIEHHYNTNGERIVIGGSDGATFLVDTLLNASKLFDGYIIASPDVTCYIDEIKERMPLGIESRDGLMTKCFISKGGFEDNEHLESFGRFMEHLSLDNLELKYHPVQGAGHATVNAECFTRGLQFFFYRDILLAGDILDRYCGQYESLRNAKTIEIKRKGSHLYFHLGPKTVFRLNAIDENLFFVPGAGIRVSVSFNEEDDLIARIFNPYELRNIYRKVVGC